MRDAIILGTGGHARVIISMLIQAGTHNILEALELGDFRGNEAILGVPVGVTIEKLNAYQQQNSVDVFLAIGNNKLRRDWWHKVKMLNLPMPNLISPTAIIDRFAELGEGNVVCANAFLGPECKIGSNNLINTRAILEHEVQVGSNCHVCPGAIIAGRVQIQDDSFIGAGAVVIDGLRVELNSVIGAGAVLVEDINVPNGVYVGVPAKRLKNTP